MEKNLTWIYKLDFLITIGLVLLITMLYIFFIFFSVVVIVVVDDDDDVVVVVVVAIIDVVTVKKFNFKNSLKKFILKNIYLQLQNNSSRIQHNHLDKRIFDFYIYRSIDRMNYLQCNSDVISQTL